MVKDGHHEGVIREIAPGKPEHKDDENLSETGNDDFYNEFSDKSGIKKNANLSKQNIPGTEQCPFCFAMNVTSPTQYCPMCRIEMTEATRNYLASGKMP